MDYTPFLRSCAGIRVEAIAIAANALFGWFEIQNLLAA